MKMPALRSGAAKKLSEACECVRSEMASVSKALEFEENIPWDDCFSRIQRAIATILAVEGVASPTSLSNLNSRLLCERLVAVLVALRSNNRERALQAIGAAMNTTA